MPEGTEREAAPPSKITPPEPGPTFQRPALIRKLAESAAVVRRTWISAPGGAGKTTLVRALVASDPRPLVWYQVDAQDHDPANLFFYLSRTLPQTAHVDALPVLTPEYLPNLAVFCRNYFRAYFPSFGAGCVLVFDDVQEAADGDLLAVVLSAAMAELPLDSTLYVLSREEPFPSLARQRINRSLAHVGWEDLRLSFEETRHFLTWFMEREPSPLEVERAFTLTQGWVAGVLLFLRSPGAEPVVQPFERMELLFDYFAGDIFARLPRETQSFLLTCSVLPVIGADMAEALTGCTDAEAILRRLTRGSHFTFRISVDGGTYKFHPLFREFLQARAIERLGAERVAVIRLEAARLFLAARQAEVAAELLIAAQGWEELIPVVAAQAPVLLQQGRTRTLLMWLKALPLDLRRNSPWLRYWYGCCVNAENPAEAREELTRAFELFDEAGDRTGSMLSWVKAVYAIVVGWNDLSELDAWIERFHRLRGRWPGPLPPEIEALMTQSICQALTWRQPAHSELPKWVASLQKLVTKSNDASFRIVAGADLVLYHTLGGDLAAGLALIQLLRADVDRQGVSTAQRLIWYATKAFAECIAWEGEQCIATVEKAKALVAETGVQFANVRIFVPAIAFGLTSDDLPLARRYLGELTTPAVALLDQGLAALMMADLADIEGNPTRAAALVDVVMERGMGASTPIGFAFALGVGAVVLYQAGHPTKARRMVQRGLFIGRGMNYFECLFQSLGAYFALEAGETVEAHEMLQRSFGIAARHGYRNFIPWRTKIMARLCREAVAAGIEVDYARRLAAVRALDLAPALTPKELEILSWVVAGKTSGEIAAIRGISERTVKYHVGNILHKLGANTRAHAVSIALERGLVSAG